jgi:hypothetical protein
MGQFLLGLFATYLLYHLIFNFVIPLVRVTRQVKKQVREFQQQANSQHNGYQAQTGPTFHSTRQTNIKKEAGPRRDDYIDFEEVK